MFRKIIAALLISLQTIGPAAAYSAADGQFFYRYTAGLPTAPSDDSNGEASKDITAFYIAGVGEDFSELLPMKAEWEDDDWKIDTGSLPDGITFNPSTLTFEGKATTVASNIVVNLKGYDANANQIATATATFSVYQLPNNVVATNFYHHTNKYASDAVALPSGVTIDGDPTLISALPPGVNFNARYFDGTPTKAGRYPILAFGYDYTHTTPIIAFKGTYVVEDGPTFASTVKDDLRTLTQSDYWGCGYGSECAVWYQEGIPKIKTPIKSASAVKYYVEVLSGKLPGSLSFGSDPLNRLKNGRTYASYDQATIRYKAVDVDDTIGYSNSFKIGSLGHTELCQPILSNVIQLRGTVGAVFNSKATGYTIPTSADKTSKAFALSSGTLPDGIKFDTTQGAFLGTPTTRGTSDGINVTITYPGSTGSTPTVCGPYQFVIAPTALSLTYTGLNSDYRTGDAVDVTISPVGSTIAPAQITMGGDAVLPSGVSFDPTTSKLSGKASEKGDFSANFTLTNGDGLTYPTSLAFSVHDPVNINDVPALSTIKRYDSADPLFTVTYDPTTVIGSETWSVLPGPLPTGFTFDKGALTVAGGTCLPVNKYGPFSIQLKDGTGQSDKTNDFYIDVTERDKLTRNATITPLKFQANLNDTGQIPFSVSRPTLAVSCLPTLNYTLIPNTLPNGLAFDPTTGKISGLPGKKQTVDGYTMKIDEVSPYNFSETSDPFSVVIGDPNPIQDQLLSPLQGNVNGPKVASVSPTSTLVKIRNSLVGYEKAVVFDGASPDVPGLKFDTTSGVLSGTPTTEFNGNVTIAYHDGGGRKGNLIVPVSIYPYPTLTSAQSVYEVPRLSDASDYNIQVTPGNNGFYKGVTYSLAPSSAALPKNYKLNGNVITGNTDSAKDLSYAIVIRGKSNSDANIYVDYPLTLKIVEEKPMKLKLGMVSDKLTWKIDEKTLAVTDLEKFTSAKPTGSYVKPLVYSLPSGPSWMTVDANGMLAGSPPAIGTYAVTEQVTDAENHMATDTATVKVTLSGYVILTPGGTAGTIKLRQGESFKTDPQVVTNVVAPYTLKSTGTRPSTVDFDSNTGVFTGYVDSPTTTVLGLDVLDNDQRTTEKGYQLTYSMVPRVAIGNATSAKNGRQYDPTQPIRVQFPAPTNIMGKASYSVTGTVPGTLYYKTYDGDTPSGLATYTHHNPDGTSVTIKQNPLDTVAKTEMQYLEPDHIIFDTLSLKLTGIPSSEGTFNIGLYVFDGYYNDGYKVNPGDSTRGDYNEATTKTMATVIVAKALDMTVTNTGSSETVAQYTGQPTLTSTVTNDAYGIGVAWSKVDGSGNLPNKVSMYYQTAQTLGYQGYPDTQGTYDNIRWDGYDWAGRKVTTDPVSITVGPRQALQLSASLPLPRAMVVFDGDANLTVTAKNLPNGKPIGKANWTVSGDTNLPPNVTYKITDSSVQFTGKSNVIGIYKDIIVSATDSLGGQASLNLTFKVISSSDPIKLVVSPITTKVNFPVLMAPPFATAALSTDNTYGTVRFSSDDLPAGSGVTIDPVTGAVSGSISTAQNLTFNMKVTDDTNRVTSAPVTVSVSPDLRLIVPSQVTATQGATTSTAVATDYALGTVTYAKGAGNWPVGFTVDPSTGKIISSYTDPKTNKVTTNVVAAAGNYPGLTVTATDIFGDAVTTYTDNGTSNTFSIVVNPTTATPDIATQAKTILGTEGTPIVNWAPKAASGWAAGVVEKGKTTAAWNYAGTVYSANYDLSQYGLTLDPNTGTISGTPTAPFIIRDFVMTVTSQRGDSDSTAAFWIGVAPKTAMVLNAAIKTEVDVRVGGDFKAPVLTWDNSLGNLTNTKTSGNTAFGVTSATGQLTAILATSNYTAGTYPVGVKVTDEFNRTATTTVNVVVYPKLATTAPKNNALLNTDYTNLFTPTITGLISTSTISVSGLPDGLSADPTDGHIYGNLDTTKYDYSDQDGWSVTYNVIDSFDGASATTTGTLYKVDGGFRYFRILDTGSYSYWGCATITLSDQIGTKLNTLATSPYGGTQGANSVTLVSKVSDNCQVSRLAGTGYFLMWDFKQLTNVATVLVKYDNSWNAQNSIIRAPQFQVSNDNVTWRTVLTGTSTGGATSKTYTMP